MAPTTRPRTRGLIVSLRSTAPAAHSPPKPSPCKLRVSKSCQKDCVKPERKVNAANHRMVHCNTRTRPTRSASTPAIHPPIAATIRTTVARIPACPLVIPHSAMSAGIANGYICVSIASTLQPPRHAQKVRFSPFVRSVNQSNMASSYRRLALLRSSCPDEEAPQHGDRRKEEERARELTRDPDIPA